MLWASALELGLLVLEAIGEAEGGAEAAGA